MRVHRFDRNATVYYHLKHKDRIRWVVTKCDFHFPFSNKRYKMTNRWDATTCRHCLYVGGLNMPKVDYSVIEEMDFSPVPDGLYDAVFSAWELKNGDKGPYYNCEFVLEGDEYKNKKVWIILSLSPKSLWRFKNVMIRLGAEPDDMAPGSDVDTDEIVAGQVGARCRLKLETEDYTSNAGEEKSRNVIKDVLAATVAF